MIADAASLTDWPAPPVLIAGPTASGKSALALAIAEESGGAVINADALQVYAEWRVLTARPSAEEEGRVPHHLYGHVPGAAPWSVGAWLREVAALLPRLRAEGRRPVIVGGTGLYFTALTKGLTALPPVTPVIRAEAEARLAALGRDAFAAELARRDPETAARIDAANPARLLRAWETLAQTGEGLATHWARTPPPLLPLSVCETRLVAPDRETLYARCDARFDAMLADGGLDEVRAARAADPPLTPQAWNALGARELAAHLDGATTLEAAAAAARRATRNYAKRQLTWARGRMARWLRAA